MENVQEQDKQDPPGKLQWKELEKTSSERCGEFNFFMQHLFKGRTMLPLTSQRYGEM